MYRLFDPCFLLVQGSQTYVEFESLIVLPKWSRSDKVEEYARSLAWHGTPNRHAVHRASNGRARGNSAWMILGWLQISSNKSRLSIISQDAMAMTLDSIARDPNEHVCILNCLI